jgi:Holliday junction DNA helicase RuvB
MDANTNLIPAPSLSPAAAPTSLATDPELEMREGLPGDEVGRRLAHAARREDLGGRVLAFYLVEMDTRRLYQTTGHGSTAYYAEKRLGLDRRRTAELLRVGRKLRELVETDRAFCAGRLCWTKVQVVARMATPEHEAAWLAEALRLDVRELKLLSACSKEGGPPRAAGDQKGLPEIRFPVSTSLSALTHAKLEKAQQMLAAELGREVDVAGLLDVVLGDFLSTEADGSVKGRKRVAASNFRVELVESGERGGPLYVRTDAGPIPLDVAMAEAVRCDAGVCTHHGSDHRARDVKTPHEMRGRVKRRDGNRCRSCRSRRDLMVHHVEFRSHGGRTRADNLITLCSRCHGLVHANLLLLQGHHAEAVRFFDSAGRPMSGPESVARIEVALKQIAAPVMTSAPQPEPDLTLVRVPREVDAAWWRRHAQLVKSGGTNGSLEFVAGRPVDAPAPEVPAPAPLESAFAGLVGQDALVARLARTAAVRRSKGKRFPHLLLTGPAGTGKSTLARGIAAAAQQPFVEVSATLVGDKAAWVRLLAGLPEGCVLFLDEAHALPRTLQDLLLQALAERRLALMLTDGTTTQSVTLLLPAFTLVAATTDGAAITAAMRSRFGLRETLTHYGEKTLAQIVGAAAAAQGVTATPEGALRLARAARGTPREAHRLVERAADHVAHASAGTGAEGAGVLDVAAVERTLAELGYDADDLDAGEQRYLEVLRESGAPMSLARLASALGTTPKSVEECVEPWLLREGLAVVTPLGRVAGSPRNDAAGRLRAVFAGFSSWGCEGDRPGDGTPNVRRWTSSGYLTVSGG